MTSKDSEKELYSSPYPLGELSSFVTKDGSISLYSELFKESFHDLKGAKTEATEKFIKPVQIENLREKKQLNVLDTCIGLGYNSASLIEALEKTTIYLNWWGLEIDKRPLQIALRVPSFNQTWSGKVLKILNNINSYSCWEESNSEGHAIWGDARETIKSIAEDIKFDLILLDAFSPSHCPELWTEDFLHTLCSKLNPEGKLITYCTAAAIRGSLRRAGMELRSIKPNTNSLRYWSEGTIAILKTKNQLSLSCDQKSNFAKLSQMEEEHLLTRAAIPYRDSNGMSTSKDILKRRKAEQELSNLETTINWRKRWKKLL